MPLTIPRRTGGALIALGGGLRLSAPRRSGFSPASLSGMQLWLAADISPKWQDSARTIPALADSDPVGAWDDLSGAGNHAIQATAGKRPLFKTSILNGRPIFRFDGVDDELRAGTPAGLGSILLANAQSCITVAVYRGLTADTRLLAMRQDAGGGFGLNASSPTSSSWAYVGGTTNAGTIAVGTPFVVTFTHLATAVATWQNGVAVGTAANGGTGVVATVNNLSIGSGTVAVFAQADVAELLVYNRALTTPERQSIERALGTKWGVVVA